MAAPPKPIDETARLAVLRSLDILDSGEDAAYDAFTRLAAHIAGTPIALITLLDENREWLKSNYGFGDVREMARDTGFCAHAILHDDVFELHDVREDSRFAQNALVTNEPFVRFYAGIPLITKKGHAIGTLCVMDSEVGWLNAEQRQQLKLLAAGIVDLIEMRASRDAQADRISMLSAAVEDAADMMIVTDDTIPPEGWPKIVAVNNEFLRQMGYRREDVVGQTTEVLFGERTDPRTIEEIAARLNHRDPAVSTFIAYRKDGSSFTMETRSRGVFHSNGIYANRVILARDVTEERAAQLELQTLRTLIDEASDFIFTTDATPGSEGGPYFTYVNNSMLRATGYTAGEVLGRSPSMFYGPATDKNVLRSLAVWVDAGEPGGGEFTIYRKDGTEMIVEFNGTPVTDEASGVVTHWVVVGRDVTSRRQTQQQLAVLSTAIEAATDCIVVYEVDPQSASAFKVVFVNEATVRESGFTREQLMSGPTGSGSETDSIAVSEFRDALRRGEPARTRLRLYRKDGSTYWGEISAQPIKNTDGQVTHIVSIERDVSDIVSREQQLQSDNETLSELMQISRELFGVLSSQTLRATFLSGVESLTGIKPVEHLGVLAAADPFLQRASASRVPVVDRARDRAAFAIAASPESPPSVVEINAAAHGKKLERNVILALQLLVQNYRTAAQNTSLYEEIEDRRAAVIELNQTKSDLIAMLAHDFRGPLTSIMGFSELLRSEDLARNEQEEFLETIVSAAQRLSSLANDTLAMSNLEENELALEIEPVDYVALARKAAEIFRDDRAITVLATPATIEGKADRARLRQVLDNLIGNAVKYSPGGGDVQVQMRKQGENVLIRVSDSGIGIPSGEIDRIFTRFSRASNARASGISGTGFGLYLTKQIVERHGGTIRAESALGKGTAFTVELPLEGGSSTHRLRILLGDHDGSIRSFTAHTLRTSGYAVKVCDSWRELEREVGTQAYDIAIVDVDTFRANVTTVQRFLDAGNAASVPVIAIGAKRVEQLEGYAAMLGKPYLAADLLATVAKLDSNIATASTRETERGTIERAPAQTQPQQN